MNKATSSLTLPRLSPTAPVAIAVLLGLLATFPATAQDAELSAEERVTAIDLLLRFDGEPGADWTRVRRSPAGLGEDDLSVEVGGAQVPVVGVEALEDADEERRGGWSQMIYVDCRMTSTAHLQWAASALAARAEDLVDRGPVEVVLADPAPEALLAPTRDAAVLRPVLLSLTRGEQCKDLLPLLRDEALSTLELSAAEDRADVARQALAAERNLTESSRLALVTRLTDGIRRRGGAQKALYLVHGGFGPESGEFYAEHLEGMVPEPGPRVTPEDAARIVASYGWTVIAVAPLRAAERPGVEVGDWYFYAASGASADEPEAAPQIPPQDPGATGGQLDDGDPWESFLGGIKGKLKERKDPEKAESYIELGNALFGQGKYERAADSYEKALYHFADSPKTRDRQTVALVQLGNALAEAGEREKARHAVDAALELDPSLAREAGAEDVALGERGHARLVDATIGRVVDAPKALDDAIRALDGRVRLTFQLAGSPTGELLPVDVRYDGPSAVEHVEWTRSSTPEEVAEARLLRLVDDELRDAVADEGDLDLDAALRQDGRLDLGRAIAAAGLEEPVLRLSTAGGTLEGLNTPAQHRVLEDDERLLELEIPEGSDFLAVLVEDLETGAWGVRVVGD